MRPDWKTCFRIGATCFALYLCICYWTFIAGFAALLLRSSGSLLLGCAIAYLVNILMRVYEARYFPGSRAPLADKSRRPVCMLAAMATLAGVVVLLVLLVLPELLRCIRLLIAEIPPAIQTAVDWVQASGLLTSTPAQDFFLSLETIDWQAKLMQAVRLLLEGVGGAAQLALSTVSSLVSILMTGIIALIFAIYLLLGKERLARQFRRLIHRYLRPGWGDRLFYVLGTVDNCFHRFIVGQCTEAVILGLLCMAGMTVLQLPYAVMVGTLIGFTALIPVAGAYIGGGIGAFMILTVSPIKALVFLIFLVVLQQLEGNLIYPRVVGTSIGLPGVWVLATVTIGGGVMGVLGMLLAVPLAAAAYQLLRQDVNRAIPPEPSPPEPEADEAEETE